MSLQVNYEDWGYGPPHPGEILREQVLPRFGLSVGGLAVKLGVSARRLGDLIAGRRPMTLDMARRLGIAFGNGPRYWLALQMQHDVWNAEKDVAPSVKPIMIAAVASGVAR